MTLTSVMSLGSCLHIVTLKWFGYGAETSCGFGGDMGFDTTSGVERSLLGNQPQRGILGHDAMQINAHWRCICLAHHGVRSADLGVR